MRIIAVDDEEHTLRALGKNLRKVFPDAEVLCFSDAEEAVTAAESETMRKEPPEFAFLDISLGGENGIGLARRLKQLYTGLRIVFCTAYSEYSLDAYSLHAVGYLVKPVDAEDIERLIRDIGLLPERKEKKIYVQTFGNFEVFIDGEILGFTRMRAKELLAYLVDRKGASVTTAEIHGILWEDEVYDENAKNKVQHVKKDLRDLLRQKGIEDILIGGWNGIAVDQRKFACDYYSYLKGDEKAKQLFFGEYMSGYDWGETTLAGLMRRE